VFQFMPTASGPVTGHHKKEPESVLFAPFLKVFIYIKKIPPEPSLHQAKRSQPSLIGEMVQSLNNLRGPLLGSLQYVHISFVLRSSELDTVLQV